MVDSSNFLRRGFPRTLLILVIGIQIMVLLVGCGGPSAEELASVDYTAAAGDYWQISTPADQGLDPQWVAQLYLNATKVETIYSLLVIKNGYLIAEDYFKGRPATQTSNLQSVTKSFTSALVGIAFQQGCLSSLDQKMVEFFPELADQITDTRKKDITIRELLQMRAGFAWEESTQDLTNVLFSGFRPSTLLEIPLVRNPGSGFDYSNLSSHLLGIIVARACNIDLKSFAEQQLFFPLDIKPSVWSKDREGNYLGYAELNLTARDMAKFGLMYLNNGVFNGQQVIPTDWVHSSLEIYSEDAWHYRVGRNFNDVGYGYQWWSVRAADHHYNLAWGHGGQQIALLDDLNMVIVVQANSLKGQLGDEPWRLEKQNLNLVADFIASLPSE
jgi:CubicO group peptidase (beta-lactamase class C family)